jgi:hypothetical protein
MKKILLALGFAVAAQPAPAVAMEQVKAVVNNPWTHAAIAVGATTAAYMKPTYTNLCLAASAVGYTIQQHGGDLLAQFKNTRTGANLNKSDHLYNKKMDDFIDNATNFGLAFTADVMVPRDAKGKPEQQYVLPMHLLAGTFNAYRATKTIYENGQNWLANLDAKKAARTSLYLVLGVATGGLGYTINKDNQTQLALLRFFARGFQDQFCTWLSNDEDHKINQAIADLAAFGTGAYFRA